MSLANNLKAFMVSNHTRKTCLYIGAPNRKYAIMMALEWGAGWLGSDRVSCSRPIECLQGKFLPFPGGDKPGAYDRTIRAEKRNMRTARNHGLVVRKGNTMLCFRKPEAAEKYMARKMRGAIDNFQ